MGSFVSDAAGYKSEKEPIQIQTKTLAVTPGAPIIVFFFGHRSWHDKDHGDVCVGRDLDAQLGGVELAGHGRSSSMAVLGSQVVQVCEGDL